MYQVPAIAHFCALFGPAFANNSRDDATALPAIAVDVRGFYMVGAPPYFSSSVLTELGSGSRSTCWAAL
jgi:hypothetical protein